MDNLELFQATLPLLFEDLNGLQTTNWRDTDFSPYSPYEPVICRRWPLWLMASRAQLAHPEATREGVNLRLTPNQLNN